MAGVGKLLKQAQKMQKKVEALQSELAARELEVTSGGGAVTITVTGQQEFKRIKIDPELLKEDPEMVEETLLAAVQDALKQSKDLSEKEMEGLTGGMQMPGMF